MPLEPNAKKEFRAEVVKYCKAAESAESVWHYTQARPFGGFHTPATDTHHNDCSGYCSLVFYRSGRYSGHPVTDPLGPNMHYSGWGYTGTAYEYLKAHKAPVDKYRIGDIAIFGTASDTVHMMVCRKAGTSSTSVWSSHGSEGGPDARQLHYHPSPLLGVYRHPALL